MCAACWLPLMSIYERVETPMTTRNEVREQVRSRYAAAATAVATGKHDGCGAGCCGDCGGSAEALEGNGSAFGAALYDPDERSALPSEAVLASLGCGNPV